MVSHSVIILYPETSEKNLLSIEKRAKSYMLSQDELALCRIAMHIKCSVDVVKGYLNSLGEYINRFFAWRSQKMVYRDFLFLVSDGLEEGSVAVQLQDLLHLSVSKRQVQ